MSDSQQKLKICILTLQFPPFLGGVATSTERLAVYMSQKGHEVHIISPGYLSLDKIITNPIKPVLENGYFVHRTFPSLANYLAHNPTENSIIFEYISGLHKKINFDLFHGMFLIPPGFMAVNLGKIFNKPSIASVRGSDVEVFMHSPLYLHPVRRVIAEANIVTGNTLAQIKKIKKISSPQKIFKTPLSINLNLFEKKSLSECIKDFPFIQKLHALVLLNKKRYFKTKFICITGYMRYQKNFETLLKAFKKVLSVKPNTHLLLIGDFTDASRKKIL